MAGKKRESGCVDQWSKLVQMAGKDVMDAEEEKMGEIWTWEDDLRLSFDLADVYGRAMAGTGVREARLRYDQVVRDLEGPIQAGSEQQKRWLSMLLRLRDASNNAQFGGDLERTFESLVRAAAERKNIGHEGFVGATLVGVLQAHDLIEASTTAENKMEKKNDAEGGLKGSPAPQDKDQVAEGDPPGSPAHQKEEDAEGSSNGSPAH